MGADCVLLEILYVLNVHYDTCRFNTYLRMYIRRIEDSRRRRAQPVSSQQSARLHDPAHTESTGTHNEFNHACPTRPKLMSLLEPAHKPTADCYLYSYYYQSTAPGVAHPAYGHPSQSDDARWMSKILAPLWIFLGPNIWYC